VEKKLTRAQREAIRHRASDLCVTAGAGSGKTRVLVERFVHLVTRKGAPVDRILAITFTEKAAAEMKERIARAFGEAGLEDLRRQVEFAYISTIDALCARILRENSLEAEVDPRFTVLEELDADRVLEEAADEGLLARSEEEMAGLLEATGISDLAGTLRGLYAQIRASGKPLEPETLEPPPRPETAVAEIRESVESLRRAMRDLNPEQRGKVEVHLDLAEELEAIPRSDPPDRLSAAVKVLRKRIHLGKVRRDDVKEPLRRIREDLLDRFLGERLEEKVRPFRILLGELLVSLEAAYDRKKRGAAALDFSDLEWKVRSLLAQSPQVRRRIAGKFDHIFLDEFQDTNPLQKEIVDLLHTGNGFFAAGDSKQSIYGFRDADVRIIAGFREQLEPKGGHVSLPDNFRSRPEIVEFSNRLFSSSLWRRGVVPFEEMVASAEHEGKRFPSVELLLAEGENAEEGRQKEAEALAERISALVEGGTLRFTRRESENLGKPLGFGDIAILFRSTTSMRIYERALAERQIPYFVQKGRGYFQTQEVRDLLNLIRILDNPRDDYHLAAVLRSPLCGLTDDDLYRLCRLGSGGKRLAERIRSSDSGLSEIGSRRLAGFLAILDRLRQRKGRGPLWLALDALISDSLLAPEALLHFNGRRRFANIRKLVDLVRGWEAQGRTSLPELAERLEDYSGPEVRESEAAVEAAGDDSLKLMTIHAAKGLEFPMVVLADLGRAERPRPHEEIFRRDLGLGIPLYDPVEGNRGLHPTSYRTLHQSREEAEKQEDNRLQYVAVTRAQEHLILSGWWKGEAAPGRSWLAAILEGLGGAAAVRANPAILRADGAAAAAATGRMTSLMGQHRDRIRSFRPLPGTPEIRGAEAEADEVLRRVALPSPPIETTPYLVTATEIVQHHLCPRRYHLRYRIGAPVLEYSRRSGRAEEGDGADVKDDELPAEALGDRVHRILAEEPGSPVIEEVLATLSARDREAARRQEKTFRNSALGREAASGEAMREFPFVMARHGATLRGQIDLILRGRDGSLKVVDYKTSRIDASEVEERAADYELQLRIYALAVRDIFGRAPGGACLHFLHPDIVREADVCAAALEETEKSISSFFEVHRTETCPQRPARRCFSCGYLGAYCPNIAAGAPDRRRTPPA